MSAGPREGEGIRPTIVVWLDAREARIFRFVTPTEAGGPADVRIDRLASDVPAHHKSTGHLRVEPPFRRGGGGPVETCVNRHRLEHLRGFVLQVASAIDDSSDVAILGPGVVRERLARHLREGDRGRGADATGRHVSERAAEHPTDGQLRALCLTLNGHPPKRRLV